MTVGDKVALLGRVLVMCLMIHSPTDTQMESLD